MHTFYKFVFKTIQSTLWLCDAVMYGINTGFGALANTRIDKKDIEYVISKTRSSSSIWELIGLLWASRQIQQNLIRSHACGVGTPLERGRARMLFALRVNVLARGYSGISADTLQGYIDIFNGVSTHLSYE